MNEHFLSNYFEFNVEYIKAIFEMNDFDIVGETINCLDKIFGPKFQ